MPGRTYKASQFICRYNTIINKTRAMFLMKEHFIGLLEPQNFTIVESARKLTDSEVWETVTRDKQAGM